MKTKKLGAVIVLVFSIVIIFCSCSGGALTANTSGSDIDKTNSKTTDLEPALDIKIDKTTFELGDTAEIEITKNDSCTGNVNVVCSNDTAFQIDGETVTAIATGEAKIYLQCDNAKSREIEIECVVFADSITLDQTAIKIKTGNESKLSATISPAETTNQTITWSSNDESIAKVNEKGVVSGKYVGTTTIIAADSTGKVKAECSVEVLPVEVEKVTVSDSHVELGKGQKFIITSSVEPSNATYKSLKWSSSDTSVADYSDGIITANGVGSAQITATASNGKSSKISVNVTKNKNSKTMYTTVVLNVRSRPSSNGSVIYQLASDRAVDVVKDGYWSMINFSSGKVGYVNSAYLSSVKPCKISNVPYLNQFSLGYPTGCEAVSATMVLKFHGYDVSTSKVISAIPMGESKHQVDGKWVGGNPFEVFVGHPSKGLSTGSYGCFAKPLAQAMQSIAGGKVKNISGCSVDTLFDYVEKGEPVVVWCVKNGNPVKSGVTWSYPDGSGKFDELVGEHCAVLIGYDSKNVYLNDPSAGQNVTQPISAFETNFKKLYSQAIVVL